MPSRGIKLNRTPVFGSAAPATPTVNSIALRRADFASLADALDYAAQGDTGANFYAGSGKLATVLPYRMLRLQAQELARRLLSLPMPRGARVAVVAETNPDFLRFFFACQYAGLVPVALAGVGQSRGPCGLCRPVARPAAGLRSRGGDGIEPVPAFPAGGGRWHGPRLYGDARRLRRAAGTRRSNCGRAAPRKPLICNTRRAAPAFPAAW